MPKKRKDEPTQRTQPRYENGATGPDIEIPIPKKGDVMSALRKVAKAPRSTPRRSTDK